MLVVMISLFEKLERGFFRRLKGIVFFKRSAVASRYESRTKHPLFQVAALYPLQPSYVLQ